MRRIVTRIGLALAAMASATPAYAQELIADSGDTGWTLAASLLVLFSIPGIALLYGSRRPATDDQPDGATRSLRTIFAGISGITIIWILIGYSIAYSPTGGDWMGDSFNWMLNNLATVRGNSGVAETAFVLFQLALAILASLLSIAVVVGRARTGWAVAFASAWTLLVYAPLTYWIWNDGWLDKLGAVDGSGGLVVLLSAGSSALIAAMIAGQTNVHNEDHDEGSFWPLVGAAFLSVGLLGMIGGGEFGASDNAASAIINALVCASGSALVWAALSSRFTNGGNVGSGFLAGLAAAAASAGFVSPGGALVIGITAGLISFFAALSLSSRLGGATSIFATHAFGAVVGALLVAIFGNPAFGGTGFSTGLGTGGQLVAQCITIAITGLWSIIGSLIVGYSAAIIWKPDN